MAMVDKNRITVKWLYGWGYSASSCAEACGVSRTHITNYLKGRTRISAELRGKILALPKRPAIHGNYIKGI